MRFVECTVCGTAFDDDSENGGGRQLPKATVRTHPHEGIGEILFCNNAIVVRNNTKNINYKEPKILGRCKPYRLMILSLQSLNPIIKVT